jgi:hypothetical protein
MLRTTIEVGLLLAAMFVLIAIASTARAGSQCQYIGDTLFCNGDDGSNATGMRIGDTDFYNGNDSRGNSWHQSCQWIGDTRFCN